MHARPMGHRDQLFLFDTCKYQIFSEESKLILD